MKLQSMTEYVLDNANKLTIADIYNYTNFLKLNLEKWMFIPCDSDGNVLYFPDYDCWKGTDDEYNTAMFEYQQAKENVIFDGFDNYDINLICQMFFTIEDIINLDLTLTNNAIKKYKL